MSEQDVRLGALVRSFRKRISLLVTERMVCWSLALAGVAGMLLAILHSFTEWYIAATEIGMLLVLGIIALLGVIGGVLYARRRPPSDLAIALTVERRLNLKQRVSTAIALEGCEEIPIELRELVAADAVAHAPGEAPHEVFPRTFSRHHKVAMAAWAAVAVLLILPHFSWLHSKTDLTERAQMRETGKTLQHILHELKKTNPQLDHNKIARQLLHNMQKLGVEMEKNRLQKKTAMVRMNKLEDELKRLEEQLDRQDQAKAKENLQKSAADIRKAMQNRSQQEREAADRAKQKLASGLPLGKLSKEERKALETEQKLNKLAQQLAAGDSDAASQTLNDLGEQNQLNLTPEQLQRLAAGLKNAQGMKNGKGKGKGKSMAQAGKDLADARRMLAGLTKPMPGMGMGMGMGKGMGMGMGMGMGQGGHGKGRGWNGRMARMNRNTRKYTRKGEIINPQNGDTPDKENEQSYSIETKGEPGQVGDTKVPYYELNPDVLTHAEHAVDSENIPPTERQRVKQYFNALDPNAP